MSKNRKQKMITPEIMRQAVVGAFTKLDPRYMMKNPVMFVVEIGFVISLVLSFAPGLLGDTTPNARLQQYCVGHSVRYGAVCKLCRISGGGARKSAGRQPEENKKRHTGAPA